MLLKASVRPQKESGPSSDETKAVFSFLPHCLPVPAVGMLWGVSFICGHVSEEEDHDSLLPVKLHSRFDDPVGGEGNVKIKRMKHLRRRRTEGAPSGHFVPAAASDWKCTPALSTLYVTVVDFSPTGPPPPTVTVGAREVFSQYNA